MKTYKKIKFLREFPATDISFIDYRERIAPVVFCLTGKNADNNFFNLWSSFLIMLYHDKTICEPHIINSGSDNLIDSRNSLVSTNSIQENDYLSDHLWNYEYIFFIDKNIEYFKVTDIYKFIKMMDVDKSIDILSYGKNNVERINIVDLKFCIIRKNIFERLEYPWFTENKYVDNYFLRNINALNLNIIFDHNCVVI